MAETLFITDLDGTLFTDEKNVHPADYQALERLRDNRVLVAIATGRSLYSYEKAMHTMKNNGGPESLPVDYVFFSTGAGILDCATGQIIYKRDILPEQISVITDCLEQKKIDYMVHAAIPDTRHFFYRSFGGENPDFHHRIQLYNDYGSPLEPGSRHTLPATEVLAILPDPGRDFSIAPLARELRDFSVVHATSPLDHRSAWIEVFHKDVSKSRTAAFLGKQMGIRPEKVVSVGNDYNDQDLLEWSGRGYITENGPESLKDRFEVVPSNNSCGVAAAADRSGWI